jgi:transcriptional regulator with XRE-family HTH domain
MLFHELLKQAMADKNVSQVELSALSGIGKSSISQYLSGKNVPGIKGKGKLAAALGVPVTFFEGQREFDFGAAILNPLKKVNPVECAKLLGKSKEFIYLSLQAGTAPFGFATQMESGKWSYHISPKKLNDYIGGLHA